jgi:hypothetical protein
MRRKILIVLLIIAVPLVSYYEGFKHGEASVYEKAKNDAKLLDMYK